MRFSIFLLLIALGLVFLIVYKMPAAPTVVVENTATTTPADSNQATSTSPSETETTKPLTVAKPSNVVDSKALEQIQNNINAAEKQILELSQPVSPPQTRLSQQELYNKAQSRVVNFFCQSGNSVKVASGVIISPKGYILTNAHVADDFDGDYECMIRQGSPARGFAYAKIVMFPKAYAEAASRQEQADNDVSIWKFSRSSGPDPLPDSFPYYDINPDLYPKKDESLATFSYPSELLGYETLLKSLNMFFAETVVTDFDRDIILSGTGLSSQVGSSGGVLVNVYTNQFAGLIFGVSKDAEINTRKLFSLTPYSIERVVKAETGLNLANFLKNP